MKSKQLNNQSDDKKRQKEWKYFTSNDKENSIKEDNTEENNDASLDRNKRYDKSGTIELNKSNYIILLSAKISKVLEPKSKDWLIVSNYNSLYPKELKKIDNIEDIKEHNHPFNITDDDINEIKRLKVDSEEKSNVLQELYN
jgi:hypothetical protein